MNIIIKNPYRTFGVFSGASTREIEKQKNVIKRYAEIGKQKEFPADFVFFGDVLRNPDDIIDAANRIEQSKNKVIYALFWFQNSSHIDETAINYLSKGETEKAILFWKKLVADNNPTVKNFSAFINLSTLLIELGFTNKNKTYVLEGISLKGKIISSDLYNGFVKEIGGDNVVLSADSIAKYFSDEILKTLDKSNINIEFNQLLDSFSSYPSEISLQLKKKYTEKPIKSIEASIDSVRENREKKPGNACRYGTFLYTSTKDDLLFLYSTLGKTNLQVKTIRNSLANEILQCSIEYFNIHRESGDIDPGEETLKLVILAKKIAPIGTVMNRIQENSPIIEDWVNDAPEREKYKKVGKDIEDLVKALDRFQNSTNSISNVSALLSNNKPRLFQLSNILGSNDKNYLDLSNAIAGNAMGMLVQVLNREQESIEVKLSPVSIYDTVVEVKSLMSEIGQLKMHPDLRARFNENKTVINNIHTQVFRLRTQTTTSSSVYSSSNRSTSSSSSSSGGCYIATMAYGDYNHPQVMELRAFRDNVLAKNYFGRAFIRFYYATSPKLVEILKGHRRTNAYIRKQLDRFIEMIK